MENGKYRGIGVCSLTANREKRVKRIGNTVALREKLKTSEYYGRFGGNACSPEFIAKYNKVNFAFLRAASKVRDLEREQWAKMVKYLSPYELRKYKLEHSQFAHDLRRETQWSQLNEGEFLALYIYREQMNNLLDSKFGGDTKKRSDLEHSALMKQEAVMASYAQTEEYRRK